MRNHLLGSVLTVSRMRSAPLGWPLPLFPWEGTHIYGKPGGPAPPAAPMQTSTWGEHEWDGAASSTDSSEEACNMILKFNFQDWAHSGQK